jgi:phospholipase/carboxylesterase
VFWGRGTLDEVIPKDYVNRTSNWLVQHSTLTERTYEIGHDVSSPEMRDVAAFVRAQIGDEQNQTLRAPPTA